MLILGRPQADDLSGPLMCGLIRRTKLRVSRNGVKEKVCAYGRGEASPLHGCGCWNQTTLFELGQIA